MGVTGDGYVVLAVCYICLYFPILFMYIYGALFIHPKKVLCGVHVALLKGSRIPSTYLNADKNMFVSNRNEHSTRLKLCSRRCGGRSRSRLGVLRLLWYGHFDSLSYPPSLGTFSRSRIFFDGSNRMRRERISRR